MYYHTVYVLDLCNPGPKNPKNKINVYLQHLVDELKELWDVGVETYDIPKEHTFQMNAPLM